MNAYTRRKACDYARRQRRRTHDELTDEIPDDKSTPEFAALMADACWRLLQRLGEDTLCKIALLKMEGHTDKEVATQLGCGLRTVERKLERIRRIWEKEVAP